MKAKILTLVAVSALLTGCSDSDDATSMNNGRLMAIAEAGCMYLSGHFLGYLFTICIGSYLNQFQIGRMRIIKIQGEN
jgi:hypothetical protein